jgi:Zn-dependent peptidase ImmA (M78 family)
MTIAQMKMATLYERLAQIGFKKNFIKSKALPSWWEEECESTPGAVTEVATYISRRLNLELSSLLDTNTQARFKNLCQPKFKKQQNTDSEALKVAQCLAARIAELTAYACKTKYQPIENFSVLEIRNQILSGRRYVDLEGVLDFCWNRGIPVVHFNKFPPGIKKFEGMVARFDNRPVIVISLQDKSFAKILFILLHELGHIYKNHLNDDILVDEKIELESFDEEEVEANEFAVELLLSKPYFGFSSLHKFISGEKLAQLALDISRNEKNVEPGSIVMNISWHKVSRAATNNEKKIIWATARKALKIIEGDVNAPVTINSYLNNYLDWSKLNDDNQEYLALMTGVEIEDVMGE